MAHANELLSRPLSDVPLAVLDVETTGLKAHFGDRVVEIAVVAARGPRVECEFTSLVKTDRPIDAGASAVNGISDAMLAGQPRFIDLLPELQPLLERRVLVAHNARFDLSFLCNEYTIAGREFVPGPALDTMQFARRRLRLPRNRLEALVDHLGVRNVDPHRALGDARATHAVFVKLAEGLRRGLASTAADWLVAQGGPAFDLRMLRNRLPPDHPINVALSESRPLRIRYRTPSGFKSTRIVRPLLCQGAYLVAWCQLRDEQRTFRVDRIASMEVVE